jgi:enoyl-CoA hydratase/carnithine racemase
VSTFAVTRARSEWWNVTFNHPPVNLVDPEMITELQDLVEQLEHDPEVAVVVFASANDEHFLGPYDMSRAADTPSTPGPTGMPPWLDLTVRMSRLPVLSIAVIRGASRGVGQEFALACDLRFASVERAAIDQPEVGHGVVPGGGAIARLSGIVGRARTVELILGSVVLDGAMAERYGVVNRALPDADLEAFVDKFAADVAGYDRQTLADAKALIDHTTLPADGDLVTAYQAFFRSVARLAP